jgi:hypothetical protein
MVLGMSALSRDAKSRSAAMVRLAGAGLWYGTRILVADDRLLGV